MSSIEDALKDKLNESFKEARKASIYGNEGRVFLVATADAYGYDVDAEGRIIDGKGKVLDSRSEDYKSIISKAQAQAMNESSIGRDL